MTEAQSQLLEYARAYSLTDPTGGNRLVALLAGSIREILDFAGVNTRVIRGARELLAVLENAVRVQQSIEATGPDLAPIAPPHTCSPPGTYPRSKPCAACVKNGPPGAHAVASWMWNEERIASLEKGRTEHERELIASRGERVDLRRRLDELGILVGNLRKDLGATQTETVSGEQGNVLRDATARLNQRVTDLERAVSANAERAAESAARVMELEAVIARPPTGDHMRQTFLDAIGGESGLARLRRAMDVADSIVEAARQGEG